MLMKTSPTKKRKLLERHLAILKQQEAGFGPLYVPSYILVQIEEILKELSELSSLPNDKPRINKRLVIVAIVGLLSFAIILFIFLSNNLSSGHERLIGNWNSARFDEDIEKAYNTIANWEFYRDGTLIIDNGVPVRYSYSWSDNEYLKLEYNGKNETLRVQFINNERIILYQPGRGGYILKKYEVFPTINPTTLAPENGRNTHGGPIAPSGDLNYKVARLSWG